MAGPMVYAASRLGIPTALMEADAHLGLANRLAAPFAKRVFLAFPDRGADGPKYRVKTAYPGAEPCAVTSGRPPCSRSPGARACPPRLRRQPGAASLNELVVETFGETGPPPSI